MCGIQESDSRAGSFTSSHCAATFEILSWFFAGGLLLRLFAGLKRPLVQTGGLSRAESCRLEADLQINLDLSVCPSVSNSADSLSRLECGELQALGCTQDKVEWEAAPEFPPRKEGWGEAAGSETNSPPFVPV